MRSEHNGSGQPDQARVAGQEPGLGPVVALKLDQDARHIASSGRSKPTDRSWLAPMVGSRPGKRADEFLGQLLVEGLAGGEQPVPQGAEHDVGDGSGR